MYLSFEEKMEIAFTQGYAQLRENYFFHFL